MNRTTKLWAKLSISTFHLENLLDKFYRLLVMNDGTIRSNQLSTLRKHISEINLVALA